MSSGGQDASRSTRSSSAPAMAKASRVPGFAREHADIDADLLQRLVVLGAVVPAEHQLGVGRTMQPAVLVDLALELARRPAGIAEREHGVGGAVAARDRLEDVERGGEADAVVDRQRGVL